MQTVNAYPLRGSLRCKVRPCKPLWTRAHVSFGAPSRYNTSYWWKGICMELWTVWHIGEEETLAALAPVQRGEYSLGVPSQLVAVMVAKTNEVTFFARVVPRVIRMSVIQVVGLFHFLSHVKWGSSSSLALNVGRGVGMWLVVCATLATPSSLYPSKIFVSNTHTHTIPHFVPLFQASYVVSRKAYLHTW